MNSLHAAGIDSSDIVIEGAYIEDAIEVIYWYQLGDHCRKGFPKEAMIF